MNLTPKLAWQTVAGGKPGRVFQIEYKIGKNGSPGKGSGFKFRIDYMDYVSNPPEFKPHYHLCGPGISGSCSDHHYF